MLSTMLIASTIALITPAEPAAPVFDRAACEAYDDGTSYQLCRAKTPKTAERLCAADWERDSDGWHSCTVGLESWRCEVQGWCSGGISTVSLMPVPDAAWAGRQEWL